MKCTYCGEEEATTKIANPNLDMGDEIDWFDEKNWWKVCEDCKKVIHLQQGLGIAEMMKDEKYASKCNKELQEIAERTGQPILNVCIYKKEDGSYETASIEFTGETDKVKIKKEE